MSQAAPQLTSFLFIRRTLECLQRGDETAHKCALKEVIHAYKKTISFLEFVSTITKTRFKSGLSQ